jgi:hypothetical protein
MTVLPSETWPSPAMATWPLRRTETIVVIRSPFWLRKTEYQGDKGGDAAFQYPKR